MKKPEDESLPPQPNQLDPDSELPPDADLEERFNDFWKKNGAGIFGGIALGAVLVVGFQTADYLKGQKAESVQAAFAEATSTEAKITFAEEHADHRLAGVALLEVADGQFESGEFVAALENYERAKDGLAGTLLEGRAQLGEGMALLLTGERAAGEAVLRSLALNNSLMDQLRAEAAYSLAVSCWEAEDWEGVQSALEIMDGLAAPGMWQFRATQLRERVPQLVELDG